MTPGSAALALEVGSKLVTLLLERQAGRPESELSEEERVRHLLAIRGSISTAKGTADFLAILAEQQRRKLVEGTEPESEPELGEAPAGEGAE